MVGPGSSSTHRLTRHLYRSLLRLAGKFDADPLAKLLIYRKALPVVHRSGMELYYTTLMDRLLGGSHVLLFSLKRPDNEIVSFRNVVKYEFRERNNDFATADRMDTAFAVLKKFKAIWKNFESSLQPAARKSNEDDDMDDDSGADSDSSTRTQAQFEYLAHYFRPYRSYDDFLTAHKDFPLKASPISPITPGRLLVAHPMVHGSVARTVVLLLMHNTDGSYGVVMNKPTVFKFGEAAVGIPDDILTPFLDSRVSFGGLVRRLSCMHPFPDCGGYLVPHCSNAEATIYANADIDKLTALAGKSEDMKKQIRFFAGCCTWKYGELEEQVEQGYWIPVDAPPDIIFQMTARERPPKVSAEDESLEPPTEAGESSEAKDDDKRRVNTWKWILNQASGQCKDIYKLPDWVDDTNVESVDL